MSNISIDDAKGVLKEAGGAIRTLTQENDELKQKLAAHQREDKIVKIARDMEDMSLAEEFTFEEKVAHLREAKDLDVTVEAIKLAAPQGNLLGEADDDVPGAGAQSSFEHFILTGE